MKVAKLEHQATMIK